MASEGVDGGARQRGRAGTPTTVVPGSTSLTAHADPPTMLP
jgi:hypothetical protein